MNVILIGYRGVGKSTVGRHVADALGWECVDADEEIERRAGKSIAALFAENGEPAFRDLESEVLAEQAAREHVVLAAGGGAVLRPANRDVLARAGKVVWLTADVETMLRRIRGDETTAARRPHLTMLDDEAEIRQLLAERTPLYQECADLTIDTAEKSPRQAAEEIIARLPLDPDTAAPR